MACWWPATRAARRLRTLRKLLPRLTANAAAVRMVRLDATQAASVPAEALTEFWWTRPCSGTGTLGRNPEIKWRLTPQDLDRLPRDSGRESLQTRCLCWRPEAGWFTRPARWSPKENEKVVESVLAESSGCRLLSRQDFRRIAETRSLIDSRVTSTRARPPRDGWLLRRGHHSMSGLSVHLRSANIPQRPRFRHKEPQWISKAKTIAVLVRTSIRSWKSGTRCCDSAKMTRQRGRGSLTRGRPISAERISGRAEKPCRRCAEVERCR